MNLILSLKPQFAQKILDGSKLYEYRKKIPMRNDIDRVYIYASKPIQAIVGYFNDLSVIKPSDSASFNHTLIML